MKLSPEGKDLNSEQLGNLWETTIVLTLLVENQLTIEWKDPKRKTPLYKYLGFKFSLCRVSALDILKQTIKSHSSKRLVSFLEVQ